MSATETPARPVAWHRLRQAFRLGAVRDNDLAFALLAALVGLVVGLGVMGAQHLLVLLHGLLFWMPTAAHASSGEGLHPLAIVLVPAVGGLLLALLAWLFGRVSKQEIVDPIEANALYGGRMSLLDSLRLMATNMVSNGFGASVGMEAAYSQLGGGLASTAGQRFQLRRANLRILVGCGAAASLAAAFNAPLAGAFYAFELVIGAYTLAALVPVCAAAVTAALVPQLIMDAPRLFSLLRPVQIHDTDYGVFLLLGFAAGLISILVMQAVTVAEQAFRRTRLPRWTHAALGGLMVGGLALYFPQVLGGGQGAIQASLDLRYEVAFAAALLVVKSLAAAISLGSGFRGGLFSSSLLLGGLFGIVLAGAGRALGLDFMPDATALVLVGMGAVGAGIIGAPITMVLLVLELTGDFAIAVGVLTGVLASSLVVRQLFGYSFATWRFHLRGVPIQGAHDVGWIRDLTMRKLMQADAKTAPVTVSMAELRRRFPLGGAKTVYALDEDGRFMGRIDMARVHEPCPEQECESKTAADFAEGKNDFLVAGTDIRTALKRFTDSGAEELPVLDGLSSHRVVGTLSEAYALRRYSLELERRRSDELGERNLFGRA